MDVIPLTWPIGEGKLFHGVYDLRHRYMRVFRPGMDRTSQEDAAIITDLDDPEVSRRFGAGLLQARQEIDLILGATPEFDRSAFLAGRQTPVFFGSAINNFGVQEVLD